MNKLNIHLLILPLSVSLLFSACAAPATGTQPGTQSTQAKTATSAPAIPQTVPITTAATQAKTTTAQSQAGSALKLLETIWAGYDKADQFPSAGGDPSETNMVQGGPGTFSLEDPSIADNILGLPQSVAKEITDAASLMHMMNANTFTAGAFQVTDTKAIPALAEALQSNIQKRQWMCGFPEQLLILSVGNYTISAFGHTEILEKFKAQTQSAFDDVKVLVEEPIQ